MDAYLAGTAVVDAAPESRVDDLLPELLCRVKVVHSIQVPREPGGVEAMDVEIDVVSAQEFAKDLGHGGRIRAVGGRVLGMVGCRDEGPPTGFLNSRGVAVIESRYRSESVWRHCGRIDRGHGPP